MLIGLLIIRKHKVEAVVTRFNAAPSEAVGKQSLWMQKEV